MRSGKNKPSKKEQRIYLPNPKKFNDLPAEKQLEELKKKIPSPQEEAIRKFNSLDQNRRELTIGNCTSIPQRYGGVWSPLPYMIAERDHNGDLHPLRSLRPYIIRWHNLTTKVDPAEIENTHSLKKYLEVLN